MRSFFVNQEFFAKQTTRMPHDIKVSIFAKQNANLPTIIPTIPLASSNRIEEHLIEILPGTIFEIHFTSETQVPVKMRAKVHVHGESVQFSPNCNLHVVSQNSTITHFCDGNYLYTPKFDKLEIAPNSSAVDAQYLERLNAGKIEVKLVQLGQKNDKTTTLLENYSMQVGAVSEAATKRYGATISKANVQQAEAAQVESYSTILEYTYVFYYRDAIGMITEKKNRGIVDPLPADSPDSKKRKRSDYDSMPPAKKPRLDASQIATWVGSLQGEISAYAPLFQKEDITEEEVGTLSDADLHTMGVLKLGHRTRLLNEIKKQYGVEVIVLD